MFSLAKYSDKYTPAADRDVNDSAVSAGLSNACICPYTADQIAGLTRLQLINQRILAQQAQPPIKMHSQELSSDSQMQFLNLQKISSVTHLAT